MLLTVHNPGSMSKSTFSTNAQSRFASVVFDGVLRPWRLARRSCGCNARGKSRALGGLCVSSNCPRRKRGSCWKERKRIVFPRQSGHWLALQTILRRGNKKIELLAIPAFCKAGRFSGWTLRIGSCLRFRRRPTSPKYQTSCMSCQCLK